MCKETFAFLVSLNLMAGQRGDCKVSERNDVHNFHHAVALIRWSLRWLGLWPLDDRRLNLKSLIFLLIAGFYMIPTIIPLGKVDYESTIQQILMAIPLIQLTLKFICIKLQAKKLATLLRKMKDDWSRIGLLSKRNKNIMLHYANRGRRLNIVCFICTTLSVLAFVSEPFQTGLTKSSTEIEVRTLPSRGWYPFNTTTSPNYEILYSVQFVVSFLYGVTVYSVDCFLAVVVFHACGQFAVVAKKLEDYNFKIHVSLKNTITRECTCLKCIVRHHASIIEYMTLVEKTFNGFVLVQLAGCSVLLAVEGYTLIKQAEDNDAAGFLSYGIYTLTITGGLFIYCYIGECIVQKFVCNYTSQLVTLPIHTKSVINLLLTTKSTLIGRSAYHLEWYNLPRSSAPSIILLMIRSEKPCKLTAGRFAIMSFSYYKTILMTSLSYISVLRAINQ